LIIDFNEEKFANEIKRLVSPFGLSKSEVEQVISYAFDAVRRSSRPVKRF